MPRGLFIANANRSYYDASMQENARAAAPTPPGASALPPAAPPAALAGKHWRSEDLLGGGSEAFIAHDGQLYRLRRTSTGKLILTK